MRSEVASLIHPPYSNRSNRSDPALVHHIHACPRGKEVCVGGLTNSSTKEVDVQEVVAVRECWLPENLTSEACESNELIW